MAKLHNICILLPNFYNSARIYFPQAYSVRTSYGTSRIGNRDVVGHGPNGQNVYKDDAHFPFPAIRFLENTRQISALRIKEKGDWRMLCCEEKKALYRASFCATFSEFQYETGSWKFVLGAGLFYISFAFWSMIFYHFCVTDDPPESLSLESRKAQLRRMLVLRVNHIDGLSSLWNYDEEAWKRDVPRLIRKENELAKTED